MASMRIIAIVIAVWFAASMLVVAGWAWFHRLVDECDVVAAAERILEDAAR